METYTISRQDFFVTHSTQAGFPLRVLRDVAPGHGRWPGEEKDFSEFSEENLKEYFEISYDVFMKRLQKLRDPRREISDYDEKELLFMLEALIHAKRSLTPSETRSHTEEES